MYVLAITNVTLLPPSGEEEGNVNNNINNNSKVHEFHVFLVLYKQYNQVNIPSISERLFTSSPQSWDVT